MTGAGDAPKAAKKRKAGKVHAVAQKQQLLEVGSEAVPSLGVAAEKPARATRVGVRRRKAVSNASKAKVTLQASEKGAKSTSRRAGSGVAKREAVIIPAAEAAGFAAMSQAVNKHKKAATPRKRQIEVPAEVLTAEEHPYRLAHNLRVWATDGELKAPEPWTRFTEAPLADELLNALRKAGFSAPTPIQAQVWPAAARGWDVIGIAKTGSGKTLGFLVPAYLRMRALGGSPDAGPGGKTHTLVLAPTRELATQIHTEASAFASASGFVSACVYGGAPKREQLPAIRAGAPILIATPGRLNDFLGARQVSLRSVAYMVLDEADRMLDMGFEPQIRDVVEHLPKQRQTLMFSATWPEEVQLLAHDFLSSAALHIQVGDPTSLQANTDISQQVRLLDSVDEKDAALAEVLRATCKDERVLVFVTTKRQCNFVERELCKSGFPVVTMHSDRSQQEREASLQRFRAGGARVLVATDVAARGLDVKGIGLVVNYDTARTTEDHVHRIGRTGRAGKAGRSITFITRSGEDSFRAVGIVEVMQKAHCHVPQEVQQIVDRVVQKQKWARETEHKWDSLPKVLMVAEKPSVAKLLAESLTAWGRGMRHRRGQSRALQTYEFASWFEPAQQKCKIIVTSTIGHVFGLDFEHHRGDIAEMFHAPVKKVIEARVAKNRVVEHIQELAAESHYLVLWLDCDREGENICFEVVSLCDNISSDNIYRAHFSALTEDEIKAAFEQLGRPDKLLALAVDARQELDLKIGCIFTRLMTRTFLSQAKRKFRLWDQTCLSYGPCQTPTLWFCVERHRERERFQRQVTYTPAASVTIAGFPVELSWAETMSTDAQRVEKLEQRAKRASRAVFKEVRSDAKVVKRPVGLNTVQLLKAASTGLGLSPSQCMKAAEALYTAGFISYPRTETTRYSDTFDIYAALREQERHPSWGKTVKYLLRRGSIQSPASGTDRGDHPPITPVKAAPREAFSKGKEWRLYDHVTRHFIASLMDDVQYEELAHVFDIGGEEFVFTNHVVRERGFLYAMPWKARDLLLNELDWEMPRLRAGERLAVTAFKVNKDQTKPPDYLRESELVSLMDKHGIGTDASIPQHMQNVVDRHYAMICGPAGEDGKMGKVIDEGKKGSGKGRRGKNPQNGRDSRPVSRHVVPTPLGLSFLASFEELDKELCEPAIRAYMERQCSQIADGVLERSEVVRQNLDIFQEKFLRFQRNIWSLERFFVLKSSPSGGQEGGGAAGCWSGWSSSAQKRVATEWPRGSVKRRKHRAHP